MSRLGLWVRSEWRTGWRALTALAVLIAIGGGITIAAAAGARRADTAFDRFLVAAGGQIQVTLSGRGDPSQLEGAWDELPTALAALPGVTGAAPMAWMAVALQGPDGEPGFFFSPAVGATAGTADNPPMGTIVVEGRMVDPSAADQVVINEFAADQLGMQVGDTIELRTYGSDQMMEFFNGDGAPDHGPRIDVEVVGVVRGAEDVSFSGEPMVFLPGGFREAYGDQVAFCDCSVIVNADTDDIDSVVAEIPAALGEFPMVAEAYDGQSKQLISRAVSLEVGALWIAAAIGALAALLVVVQALARHLGGHRRSGATLSAVGATRSEIVQAWSTVLTPVALVGAVGAGVLATLLSPLFPRGLARRAEPDPGVRFDSAAIVGGVLVVALIVLAASVLVAIVATRVSGRERAVAATSRSAQRATRLPPTAALGVNLAIDPARDRSRLAATTAVLGLAIAIGSVLAVAMIERSTSEVLSTPAAFAADWDLELVQTPDDPEATLAATLALPVEAVAFQYAVSGTDFAIHGPGGTGLAQPLAFDQLLGSMGPIIEHGLPAITDGDAVIGSKFAAQIGATVGDELTFDPGGETFEVSGIGRLSDGDETDNFVVISPEGVARLTDGADSDIDGVYVRLGNADQATQQQLAELGWTPVVAPSKVQNLDQVGTVPRLLAIALAILGIVGAIHALLVATSQRRGDIAVARALGLTPLQARSIVTWQAVATAAAAIVIGVPAGLLAGRMIWKQVAEGVGAVDLVSIAWVEVIAVPVVTIVAMAVVGTVVGRRASRLQPARVLRSE